MRLGLVICLALVSARATAQPGLEASSSDEALLRRSGLFHLGISLELMNLGSLQAITSHGKVVGVDFGIALHYDLGPNWSLHMPIEFGAGGFGNGAGYGELAIIPGVLYRFRSHDSQRWVPYVGGGLRAGYVGIGRTLVGLPLTVACCHDWGDDVHHTGKGDPNTENGSASGGELWAGFEWNRTRWFSVQLAGAAAFERVSATNILVFRETLGLRLSI